MDPGSDRRGTVVICDDDEMFCGMVSRMLTDDGWQVISEVNHAIDAINLSRAVHPDVVVLDVSMAGMSGIDAIPDLLALGAAVVVCSAFGTSHDAAGRAGATAVVDKTDIATLPAVLAALRTRSAPDPSATA